MPVKSKVEISQNFVAFLENMNFTRQEPRKNRIRYANNHFSAYFATYIVYAMRLFVHEVKEKHMSLSRVFLLYDSLDMAFINALCSAGTSQVINHLKLKLAKYF